MTTKEANQKAVVRETKSGAERHGPQFIPKLKGKKVIIRLISGGQPITGTIEGYNPPRDPHPDIERAAPGIQARHCHYRDRR